ncbi:MAG: CopG family transcriptional regulator [Deltaproteobacteria bacterium]|nr:CopG family transcriptional regulator [Deltaproteobacteria bacterium]
MSRRNVTVAIDEELLREARHLAVERGTSLSALLGETLAGVVRGKTVYRQARERQRSLLRNPPDLGTGGKAAWRREDLHER